MPITRIEWVTNKARLAAIKEPWDHLAAGEPTPFLCHDWFRLWWEAFGAHGSQQICTLWRGDELRAVFPLWAHRNRLHAMANRHTDVFRPFAKSDDDLQAIIDTVLSASFTDLTVPALPGDHPATRMLVAGSHAGRRFTIFRSYETRPIVDTAGSFEDFRRKMSRNTRHRAGRLRRKLERSHEVSFEVVEIPADPDLVLHEAFEVEAKSWKGRCGTAILSAEDTATFYRTVCKAFHRKGDLRLSGLRVDGRLIAADLALLHQGRLYLLKTGFDEAFSRWSPGILLRMAVIERCFELGIEAHELLGHTADWKAKFATGQRETMVLRSYRYRPVPAFRYAVRITAVPVLRPVYIRFQRWRTGRQHKRGPRGATGESKTG